jgi:trans-aconitate methyltransferase
MTLEAVKFIELFNGVLFWFAAFTLAWNVYFVVFNRGIPNIRSAPAIRKKIIEQLKEDKKRRGRKTYTVVDLGSGNGLFTREIASMMPRAHVIGLEVSPQQYAWATMMKQREKLDNLEYKKVDFFKYDTWEADAVVLFQLDTHRIGQKLHHDLKKDTLVISNKFPLGDGWKHDRLLEVKTFYPFQKKVYVYHAP